VGKRGPSNAPATSLRQHPASSSHGPHYDRLCIVSVSSRLMTHGFTDAQKRIKDQMQAQWCVAVSTMFAEGASTVAAMRPLGPETHQVWAQVALR
jgi:hypothetical protein